MGIFFCNHWLNSLNWLNFDFWDLDLQILSIGGWFGSWSSDSIFQLQIFQMELLLSESRFWIRLQPKEPGPPQFSSLEYRQYFSLVISGSFLVQNGWFSSLFHISLKLTSKFVSSFVELKSYNDRWNGDDTFNDVLFLSYGDPKLWWPEALVTRWYV